MQALFSFSTSQGAAHAYPSNAPPPVRARVSIAGVQMAKDVAAKGELLQFDFLGRSAKDEQDDAKGQACSELASTIGVIEDYIASGDVDGLSDALYRTSTLIQGNKHLEIVARMQFQAIPRLVRALKEFVRGPTRVQTPIILLLEQFSRSTTSNCVAIAKSCPHALGTIGIVVSTHAHDAELAPRCATLYAHLLRVKSNAKAILLHEKDGRLVLALLASDACWPTGGIALLRALLAIAQGDRKTKTRKLRQAMIDAKLLDGLRETMRRHYDHMLVVQARARRRARAEPRLS